MSKISTEDCKDFLVTHFMKLGLTTSGKDWKRAAKYKEDGVWVRDFEHSSTAVKVSIIENNNSLSIKNENDSGPLLVALTGKSNSNDPDLYKVTLKYLQKIIKLKQEGDDDAADDIIASDGFSACKKALPQFFKFHFPESDYGNLPEAITDGLNSKICYPYDNETWAMGVHFICTLTDEELYMSDLLSAPGVLPDWMDRIDEDHHEVMYRSAPKDMTVN